MTMLPPDPVERDQPIQTLNADGRGPGLIICDHASNRIPESHGSLGLDEASLRDHIAWDVGAAELSEALATRLDMAAILSGYSRLFIDCNRTPDHPELVRPESDGRRIPGNCDLTPLDIAARRKLAYDPYHAAIEHWLDEWLTSGSIPVVLSVHSMTRQLEGQPVRPWQVCILWNQDGRLAQPLLAALRGQGRFVIGDNEPYSGRDLAGATRSWHSESRGLPHVIFEIRNDLLRTAVGIDAVADALHAALEPVLADPELFTVRHY
jgi:predicted N-formylglutamate amidohydrolase